jgi:hypothetical protein
VNLPWGRLQAQVAAGVGQTPASRFESRIGAEKVQVVGVFVTAGDGENASADHVRQAMSDARLIAPNRKQR